MKLTHLLIGLILTSAIAVAGDGTSKVTYVSHEKLTALFEKGGGVATGANYSVGAMRRSTSGSAEMHDKQTDVYYIEDGSATFITGGTLLDDKLVSPGQHQGSGIKGGEIHHLAKGDVVVIPAGVPHWYKEVPHSINYLLVKVEKP